MGMLSMASSLLLVAVQQVNPTGWGSGRQGHGHCTEIERAMVVSWTLIRMISHVFELLDPI